MRMEKTRHYLHTSWPEAWIALLGLGIALSPTNTKVAGAAWLLLCVAGLIVFFRLNRPALSAIQDTVVAANRGLVIAYVVCTVLAIAVVLYWPDQPDTLHAEWRLLLAAVATNLLIARKPDPEKWRAFVMPAMALACIAAFGMAWKAVPRYAVPSNLIPWSVSVALFLCVLLPHVLDSRNPATNRRLYAVAVGFGFGSIFLSQARGALGVLVWAAWLLVENWKERHPGIKPWQIAVAGLSGAAILASSAWLPSDPIRLREGLREFVAASAQGNFNSSMGARVYNWSLGWSSFKESPWVGIGGRERLNRIKSAGTELPPDQQGQRFDEVRRLGHVHNQFLHSAMDGGVVGLVSTLAVLVGLGFAAFRLRHVDPVATRQLQGILFMHTTAGLTNVNMAHNYYAIMLSLAVATVFGCAGSRAVLSSGKRKAEACRHT